MNIKPYQNNFNAYRPIKYNKQTKTSENPIINTIEDTKHLTINKVETNMDIKLVFTNTYNNKGQIAKPKGTLKIDETYVPPEKSKTEEEKFIEEVNIVNKMDKDLFTEKQIEDIKKIVSHIDPDYITNNNINNCAKVGLTISQLKYYANNHMNEKQKEQFLKDIDKGMELTNKKLEESNERYNSLAYIIYKNAQKIDPSIPDYKYIKLEDTYGYKTMNNFSKVDVENEESFKKIFNDYKNLRYSKVSNEEAKDSVRKELEEIQKMWDDFKHLIK